MALKQYSSQGIPLHLYFLLGSIEVAEVYFVGAHDFSELCDAGEGERGQLVVVEYDPSFLVEEAHLIVVLIHPYVLVEGKSLEVDDFGRPGELVPHLGQHHVLLRVARAALGLEACHRVR